MSRSNPVSRRHFWAKVRGTIAELKALDVDLSKWTMNDVFRYMTDGSMPK